MIRLIAERWLAAAAAAVFAAVLVVGRAPGTAWAQSGNESPTEAAPSAAELDAAELAAQEAAKLRLEMEQKFLHLERRLIDQNALGLRRMEQVEERVDASAYHVDRLALIFGLSILVIFLFIGNNLSSRLKTAEMRVRRASEDAQSLMRDIERELSRPEVHHLHISQILRRLMRQLREQRQAGIASAHIEEVRRASNDPYLPVSLYLIARILVAEHDQDWNVAVQMLEQLREMDGRDPDVLLHLSHVHKHIASVSADAKVHDLHERLSYEYYGKFAAVMKEESAALEEEDAKIAPPPALPKGKPVKGGDVAIKEPAVPEEKPAAPAAPPAAAPPPTPSPAPTANGAAKPKTIPAPAPAPAPKVVEKEKPPAPKPPPAPTPSATPALKVAEKPAAETAEPPPSSPAKSTPPPPAPAPAAAPPPPPPAESSLPVPVQPAGSVPNVAAAFLPAVSRGGASVKQKFSRLVFGLQATARAVSEKAKTKSTSAEVVVKTAAPEPPAPTSAEKAQSAVQKAAAMRAAARAAGAAETAEAAVAETPAPSPAPAAPKAEEKKTEKPVAASPAPAEKKAEEKKPAPAPAPAPVKPAAAPAPKPVPPKVAAAPKPAPPPPKPAPAAASPTSTPKPTPPPAAQAPAVRTTPAAPRTARLSAGLSAARRAGGAAWSGAARLLRQGDDAPLPFLPVPATSQIPANEEDKDKLAMWRGIRRGDLTMARTAEASSLRERNKLIDDALTQYAQAAQGSTNETLYLHWGITLLAKALHVPEKKRAPFYNAAVDKFLAGNVIAAHFFDFHLASLYAIIGNKAECRKWLAIAREHGRLDVDALRQAPDFDAVRQEAWFKEFA